MTTWNETVSAYADSIRDMGEAYIRLLEQTRPDDVCDDTLMVMGVAVRGFAEALAVECERMMDLESVGDA